MLHTGCPFVFHITVTVNGNYSHKSKNLFVFVMGTHSFLYEMANLFLYANYVIFVKLQR